MRKSGNAADRRPVVLELAPEGRALMARLGRIAQAFRAKLLAGLGPEAGVLDRLLSRLAGTETGTP
ncbi:MarR family winged helix-turn-helix transcriptional regulator [Paracoccus sp. APAP_BH8]|uniref:MarR family winged helix-turn-helix transcriptional regulator n=1 Tax=Paracoccus TaxID=265 RepID=UPI001AD6AEAA|nr:MarR family winged helix-turn-helix transcriptional regulator [Paracoccus pantotrophus]